MLHSSSGGKRNHNNLRLQKPGIAQKEARRKTADDNKG
jgi:hypothetical protein